MKNLSLIEPQFADYELIDSGDRMKLERFGKLVTARPEPQAIWRRAMPESEWDRLADAVFERTKNGSNAAGQGDERGKWQVKPGTPERWTIDYNYGGEGVDGGMQLRVRLALTGFKHVGIFPEQAANWNFIFDTVRKKTDPRSELPSGKAREEFASERTSVCVNEQNRSSNAASGELSPRVPRVLNLFAYTGGATLAARAAGGAVTHVDSVKQTVSWARDNLILSGLDDTSSNSGGVRWIVDDALKFVQREVRRGSLYDGIILDPPAYGRGPEGEKWVLEERLDTMLELCSRLLSPRGFLVLNLYSMGLSALVAQTAVRQHFGTVGREQFGELYFTDRAARTLPLGVYYRLIR